MEIKLAMTVFMASAVLLISIFAVKAEDISAVTPVSTSASLRGRSLLNLTPPSNTCRLNRALCSQPGSAGPKCCDEVCVNTSTDNNNCGLCGRNCRFGKTCCDGDCVDLQRDEDNCGRCGLRCPRRISINNFRRRCENGLCDYN